ncbi:type II toxin-antitoxin system HigB family toxin [Singulisphaera sp. Ch08]|uniref:Type II toxin-antitoxin system HigB family toxin n=1 Tax=Singulisphaera sp. Ch08 TaxID=3120278 RepID=A0AAU7CC82_9BACT
MANEKKPTRNHLISRKKVFEFVANHPGAERDLEALLAWCKVVENDDWRNFADVRAVFPYADLIGDLVCFNVGGNKYRILVGIDFRADVDQPAWVYVEMVLTHKEYDKLNLG